MWLLREAICRCMTAFHSWVSGNQAGTAGSPFWRECFAPSAGVCLLTWHFISRLVGYHAQIWISHCLRAASLRAGRSTGNKVRSGQFCVAVALVKHGADKRNLFLTFSRMNDPIVCNKIELPDFWKVVKYNPKCEALLFDLILMFLAITSVSVTSRNETYRFYIAYFHEKVLIVFYCHR